MEKRLIGIVQFVSNYKIVTHFLNSSLKEAPKLIYEFPLSFNRNKSASRQYKRSTLTMGQIRSSRALQKIFRELKRGANI